MDELENDEEGGHDINFWLQEIDAKERGREEECWQITVERVHQMTGDGDVTAITDDVEETDEDRKLEQGRQTRLQRIDLHLLPEFHRLLLNARRIPGILLLDLVHTWLQLLELLLPLERMLIWDQEQELNQNRQNEDCDTEVMTRHPRCDEDQTVEERACDERAEDLRKESWLRHREASDEWWLLFRNAGEFQRDFVGACLLEERVLPGCETDFLSSPRLHEEEICTGENALVGNDVRHCLCPIRRCLHTTDIHRRERATLRESEISCHRIRDRHDGIIAEAYTRTLHRNLHQLRRSLLLRCLLGEEVTEPRIHEEEEESERQDEFETRFLGSLWSVSHGE